MSTSMLDETITSVAKGEDKIDKEDKEEKKEKTLNKFIQLKDIDLSVNRGDFVCVIGDVGSGKSSLLNAIVGDMIYVP